ncbi:MAG: ATP-binding protein [Corynebacterium sp.]|nr:ATP-binding protein [Corynebacterium sp.]
MILEFRVTNYRSYRDTAIFSMIPTREQKFRDRLAFVEKRYRKKVNPIAAVYGPNASGKSNLLRGIVDLQLLIQGDTTAWKEDLYFRLDAQKKTEPVVFQVHFLHKEMIYVYGLSILAGKVVEEYLYQMTSVSETLLFERDESSIELGKLLDDPTLGLIKDNIEPNETFAHRLGSTFRNKDEYSDFCAPYLFFKRVIAIGRGGTAIPHPLYRNEATFSLNKALEALDTGLLRLDFIDAEFSSATVSEAEAAELLESRDISEWLLVRNSRMYLIASDVGGKSLQQVRFIHQGFEGEFALEWQDLSHGTQKIISILPWLWIVMNAKEPPVLLIDELDLGLHTSLVASLIDAFLARCTPQSRGQLLFTAHDLLLMDLEYLRRDEIWICEKGSKGASELIRLTDYKGIRADLDIRKSYLEGRFGGMPQIFKSQLCDALDVSGSLGVESAKEKA